ncbi:MAG: lamin tail domain-containing protein [Fidelibacterota bacterium]
MDAVGSTNIVLNNTGDILYLRDATGTVVDSVDFWDEETFPDAPRWGVGPTCELIDPLADNNDPNNWAASFMYGGTPGSQNQVAFEVPKIIISEVMYNQTEGYEFIELMNAGDVDVDISGWWITDDNPTTAKTPIPASTTLAAGDFYVILVDSSEAPPFAPDHNIAAVAPIGLNNDKENIVLFNANDTMVTFMHYDDGSSSYGEFAHAPKTSGHTLEIIDINCTNWEPLNWQLSLYVGGSPGALNATPASLVLAEIVGTNKVDLTYSEPVDSTQAVTKTNYKVDHGVGNPDTVIWLSEVMVELTVSEIKWDTTYALAVWNVTDLESGTPIPDSTVITYGRYKPDAEPPVVVAVNAMTDSTVVVEFNEEVDSTSAVTLTNYSIDNSIGNPLGVTWFGDKVELALAMKLTLDATYTITVNGITDLYENTMTTAAVLEFVLRDYSGKIIINEFTYNSEYYDNEFIELYNNSDETINIAGWGFQNSLDKDVLIVADTIDTEIEPGTYWTVWLYADPLSRGLDWPLHFTPDWNAAIDLTDSTKIHVFNLWNSGSDISLYDEAGRTVDFVDFKEEETFNQQAKWGVGVTLERIDPDGPSNDPENWMASWYYGGSPGAANRIDRPVYPKIVINEIMYHSADGNTEFVELKNLDDVAVDISGWWLRRDNPTLPKVPFTGETTLQPGDFYVVLIDSLGGQDLGFVPDMNYTNISKINYSNSKDNVILFNDDDMMVTYVHYDDGAHSYSEFTHAMDADGLGKSLEYWDYRKENWEPLAWAASQDSGGTPGRENFIPDVVPPVVDSALAISDTTVRVYFNEELNYTTAVNKNNYTIDNGIGNPLYNLLESGNMSVILYLNPTNPLVEGTNYTVTVTGVTDVSGNAIEDMNTATFVGPAVVGINGEDALPKVFALHKNYPNPFNPVTTINYDLPKDANVRIVIYDVMGREVRTLVNRHQKAGYRTLQWNALDNRGLPVSSGFYFYVMDAGNFHKTEKMLLLK